MYDYDKAEDLTVEDLEKEQQPKTVDSSAVGRVVTEYGWYFACVVDPDTALKLKGTSSVDPFAEVGDGGNVSGPGSGGEPDVPKGKTPP